MNDVVTYEMWLRRPDGTEQRASLWDTDSLKTAQFNVDAMNDAKWHGYFFVMEVRTTRRPLDTTDMTDYADGHIDRT